MGNGVNTSYRIVSQTPTKRPDTLTVDLHPTILKNRNGQLPKSGSKKGYIPESEVLLAINNLIITNARDKNLKKLARTWPFREGIEMILQETNSTLLHLYKKYVL